MRVGITPLRADARLDATARFLADQRRKSLPVVVAEGCVIGMLTETDFLRRLKAETFVDLLLRLVADQGCFTHRGHETPVSGAMTTSAVTVTEDS
jgi:CBS domain-containing membrane protein